MIYYTQIEWLNTLYSCKNSFNRKVNSTVSLKKPQISSVCQLSKSAIKLQHQ